MCPIGPKERRSMGQTPKFIKLITSLKLFTTAEKHLCSTKKIHGCTNYEKLTYLLALMGTKLYSNNKKCPIGPAPPQVKLAIKTVIKILKILFYNYDKNNSFISSHAD